MKYLKPIYFIFAGAVITLLGSIFPSLNDLLFSTPLKFNSLAIIGGAMTAVAALIHNSASSAKSTSILKNTIDSLKQVQELTAQNAELSTALGKTTLELQGYITGGDSFCEVEFQRNPYNNFCKTVIINHGKYPLHDFEARVCDLEELKEHAKTFPPPNPQTGLIEFDKRIELGEFKLNIGTVLPGIRKELMVMVQLGKHGDLSSFNIFIDGKNGNFIQSLRMYKSENGWIKAVKILNFNSAAIIYEMIDPNFPQDKLKW